MPVNFLTKEQQESYGRYNVDPSEAQLARYFYLDDNDMNLINQRRGERNRLGFALQLGTVRFLGTFLVNPTEVPTIVVDYLAKQLDITNKECISRYGEGETHWDHAAEIKRCSSFWRIDQEAHYGALDGLARNRINIRIIERYWDLGGEIW